MLMGGPVLFRDGVMNIVGAHNSPKALYGASNGALTEDWHTQQSSDSGVWQLGQVGSGWNLRDVTNDGPALYAVDAAGVIRWYRHNATNIGPFDTINAGQPAWTYGAPSGIGTGMNGYRSPGTPRCDDSERLRSVRPEEVAADGREHRSDRADEHRDEVLFAHRVDGRGLGVVGVVEQRDGRAFFEALLARAERALVQPLTASRVKASDRVIKRVRTAVSSRVPHTMAHDNALGWRPLRELRSLTNKAHERAEGEQRADAREDRRSGGGDWHVTKIPTGRANESRHRCPA